MSRLRHKSSHLVGGDVGFAARSAQTAARKAGNDPRRYRAGVPTIVTAAAWPCTQLTPHGVRIERTCDRRSQSINQLYPAAWRRVFNAILW
jgi:hypothetical protein